MSESNEKATTTFVAGNTISPEVLHATYGIPLDEVTACRDLIRIYSNQDAIVAEADNDDAMYILRAGTVKVFRRAGVAQKFMGTMDAMCIFGELSMINHEPRSATVIAMSDKVLVYRIEHPNLHEVAANPQWAEMLISNLSMLLAKSIQQHILALEKVKELRHEVERLTAGKP